MAGWSPLDKGPTLVIHFVLSPLLAGESCIYTRLVYVLHVSLAEKRRALPLFLSPAAPLGRPVSGKTERRFIRPEYRTVRGHDGEQCERVTQRQIRALNYRRFHVAISFQPAPGRTPTAPSPFSPPPPVVARRRSPPLPVI